MKKFGFYFYDLKFDKIEDLLSLLNKKEEYKKFVDLLYYKYKLYNSYLFRKEDLYRQEENWKKVSKYFMEYFNLKGEFQLLRKRRFKKDWKKVLYLIFSGYSYGHFLSLIYANKPISLVNGIVLELEKLFEEGRKYSIYGGGKIDEKVLERVNSFLNNLKITDKEDIKYKVLLGLVFLFLVFSYYEYDDIGGLDYLLDGITSYQMDINKELVKRVLLDLLIFNYVHLKDYKILYNLGFIFIGFYLGNILFMGRFLIDLVLRILINYTDMEKGADILKKNRKKGG